MSLWITPARCGRFGGSVWQVRQVIRIRRFACAREAVNADNLPHLPTCGKCGRLCRSFLDARAHTHKGSTGTPASPATPRFGVDTARTGQTRFLTGITLLQADDEDEGQTEGLL